MQFNEDISSVLGSKVNYKNTYDPSILVRESRSSNRTQYGITSPLPFVGKDVWNCYEISFLGSNGLPVSAVAKIVYDCSNEYIVESKSLKLYLNSFNMFISEGKIEDSIQRVKDLIRKDLSDLLGTDVALEFFFDNGDNKLFIDYVELEKLVHIGDTIFSTFKEDPSLLRVSKNDQYIKIRSSLLRSNCKITNQPDWGDLFLLYKGSNTVDLISLMEYLVSFRGENHFHEEVVEMIYKRLYDALDPEELMVGAIYTRRGGIDINPIRANKEYLLEENLIDVSKHCQKTLRQ